ncbi:sigma-54-dependent Fis family transcriptional regulator [Paraburkholderia sp.]|uniref:sigma-54-dependent Fis family transcriptional regulator n=1 Tax=Paraburkholderia sp. TaxID=1926495 RepID=UPI00239B74B0|nr:sigma-54-dependent Fis family transcriptional regulator [Paraburkholderia sp.]MDE1179781.1 sigma-54-dependent Fis family transcriptional regulator [Paraburkholderia sp.]
MTLDVIRQSHERSRSFGLSDGMRPDYRLLDTADLAIKRDQNRCLCAHALPVMETLYGQIANTHSMVALTDADGLILHSLGDDDFLARAERVALQPGALWSEAHQGTNAIGTTIAAGLATTVLGNQHYLRVNRFLACSSVPILDPFGALLGVLDVTGDSRNHHQHTMALAKMSAQMIENHLFTSAFPDALCIHFHGRPEFLGTLMEGIAAFTPDGRFVSANRSAQFQLGLSLAALRAHTMSSLFDLSHGELLAQMRHRAAREQPMSLCLHSGVSVFANVMWRRATSVTLDEATPREPHPVAPVRSAVAATSSVKLSGLRYLMTGDERVATLVERVRKVIGKDIALLIGGETGTGKDVLARAVHRDSPCADGPFIAVNCSAIPDSLIEAELFGYDEGAFTGASRRGAPGKILQADGGTLFLDEIGDMPPSLQTRLLRVLQERTVTPLGSTRVIPVEFSLICATNRNLRDGIERGAFREDLYYRINGMNVTLPPLRERTDLAAIVDKILRAERSGETPGAAAVTLSPEVMAAFVRHRWPGNVRQLANVLRTACAMLDDGETVIRDEHLPQDFFDTPGARRTDVDAGDTAPDLAASPVLQNATARLDELALSAVASALEMHRGNVSAAARMLGVSRNTLYRKMSALGAKRTR